MFDVACRSCGEQRWFLRHQANLRPQPVDIEILELDTIELDASADRVTSEGI
jgi:hypothetical protein